jgi:hypothetical protein
MYIRGVWVVDKGRVVNRVAGKYQWSHSTAFQPGGGLIFHQHAMPQTMLQGRGQKVVAGGGLREHRWHLHRATLAEGWTGDTRLRWYALQPHAWATNTSVYDSVPITTYSNRRLVVHKHE